METLTWLALGFGAGWFLHRWLADAEAPPEPAAAVTAAPAPAADAEPLAVRLHALDADLEPFGRELAHIGELDDHPAFRAMVARLADPAVPVGTVLDYAFGTAWLRSCAALAALKQRADGGSVAERVTANLDHLAVWQLQFALRYLVERTEPKPSPALPLLSFRSWWQENSTLPLVMAEYFAALGIDADAGVPAEIRGWPSSRREELRNFLGKVHHPLAVRLAAGLGVAPAAPPASLDFLNQLGRFWSEEREEMVVIEPAGWKDALAAAESVAKRTPARSLLVSGEPMVGKSSFLRLLAQRRQRDGWRVFEASAADLQAGQQYIGQLEGRIRQALDELAVGRKLIWYVPDFLTLALSGTHQGQSASILDQILPAIAQGRAQIWSEATPARLARLLELRPGLRRAIEVVRIDPMSHDDALELTTALAGRIAKDLGIKMVPGCAEAAIEAAEHHFNTSSLPGSALALVRMTAMAARDGKGLQLSGQDVLATLAKLTGLPLSILDGREKIDLAALAEFFSKRVIGQPEAVSSIVERVAMLKSGLNDPSRPIGVFLFAGPTGTGKTELAKAVAEYLFGSVDRMIRLDMSEFQSADSVAKIIGGGNLPPDAETLINRVRKQPFSLILLDEFEKSAAQIWDLFLQVFDEGRLTDAAGHTADFRHSLIILTTNLGATTHRSSGLGFSPSQAAFSNDQIHRAIAQTFRPEFQNRLDKVIVFKPLTRELMRGILTKELDRVFVRRGLKDRAWAVEWEASALEFLLEKGFTPEMGARPLKRAIDQYVIAPLAATIVERRFPEGDQFVFVRREDDALRAVFVDPDGDDDQGSPEPAHQPGAANGELPVLPQMIRAPTGSRLEVASLATAREKIAARLTAPEWVARKEALSAELATPDFWGRADRFVTLTRLELMDRIEVAAGTAASIEQRLSRRGRDPDRVARDVVARLALQIHLVEEGLRDLDADAATEAAVAVEAAFGGGAGDQAAGEAWRQEVAQMYRGWARARNMSIAEITGVTGVPAPVLVVTGFGAWRVLTREAGLHVLECADGSRLPVRALVTTLPPGNLPAARVRRALADGFANAPRTASVVRRYRREPAPLVRNADGSWRSGKVDEVLAGNFDVLAGAG